MKWIYTLAGLQHCFVHILRIGVFLVMVWIGGLKAFSYEAEGIVPFVANSPLMSFFYQNESHAYKQYMNKEGEVIPKNRSWHEQNGTYVFSYGLGIVIVFIGILVLCGVFQPTLGLIGGLLTFLMSLVTLSFLLTTPEVYVPDLGGAHHGFPFLSGAGRLVLKDIIMLGAGLLIASDSAADKLRRAEHEGA
ncbi:DUF417 family protein [Sphingobacterium suaedae]|uniref:DUF417 family protein n=1 Tax=Sphingobacterium suaedae TaxID=1686402 RepID=A0ABW5KGZ8_9SPHI